MLLENDKPNSLTPYTYATANALINPDPNSNSNSDANEYKRGVKYDPTWQITPETKPAPPIQRQPTPRSGLYGEFKRRLLTGMALPTKFHMVLLDEFYTPDFVLDTSYEDIYPHVVCGPQEFTHPKLVIPNPPTKTNASPDNEEVKVIFTARTNNEKIGGFVIFAYNDDSLFLNEGKYDSYPVPTAEVIPAATNSYLVCYFNGFGFPLYTFLGGSIMVGLTLDGFIYL